MADVELAISTRLTAHAGTNALIAGRAWHNALPPNPTLPAVIVDDISALRTPLMGADANAVRFRVQVTSWATSEAGVKALDEQVRAALQRKGGTWGGMVIDQCFVENEFARFESSTRLWRFDRDFFVWGRE